MRLTTSCILAVFVAAEIPALRGGTADTSLAITGVSPGSVVAGTPGVTLSISGSGFWPGTVARWDGKALTSYADSYTHMQAWVTPELLVRPGTVSITAAQTDGTSSNPYQFNITAEAPAITDLLPSTASAGGPDFQMIVLGANFPNGAVVYWNGTALPTTYYGTAYLIALVSSTLLSPAGPASITVAGPLGPTSRAAQFTVRPVTPTIGTLSPSTAALGSHELAMTVSGSNFVMGASVRWNGSNIPTQFVNSTQLIATVPASLLAIPESVNVTVFNAGGNQSFNAVFVVNAPTPVVLDVSPASAPAGTEIKLVVTGKDFSPGCLVQWNGFALPTSFVDSTKVTTTVTGSLVSAGTVTLTVVSRTGQVSNSVAFTVAALKPAITALDPPSVAAGSPAITLVVKGSTFSSGAAVLWNGTPLTTAFVSGAELWASVPASLLKTPGAIAVSVTSAAGVSAVVTFPILQPGPLVHSGGILNAASYLPSIAPGSLISVFGERLAEQTIPASTVPLPVKLGETSVIINGTAAPLLFVSPTQINAQVPFETALGPARLVVENQRMTSAPSSVEVLAVAPGMMQLPQSRHALIQNHPSGALNSSDFPVRPGQYVVAYLTGQGALDVPIATGYAAPGAPFSRPLSPVSVFIGGQPAVVAFAGMAPGMVGVLQLNILIPAVIPGEQLMQVKIGNAESNSAAISIAAALEP